MWKHLTILLVAAMIVFPGNTLAGQDKEEKKEESGKALFLANKCNSCHSLEVAGIKKKPNQKPPDLSMIGSERNGEWITKYLKKQEAIEGRKHMLSFKGSDEDLAALAKWLETLKSEKKEGTQ